LKYLKDNRSGWRRHYWKRQNSTWWHCHGDFTP
jgi:hypothetical protein